MTRPPNHVVVTWQGDHRFDAGRPGGATHRIDADAETGPGPVDTLLNALVREGRVTVGAAAGIRAQINRAYDAVRSPESYNPVRFRAALGGAAGAIGSLR